MYSIKLFFSIVCKNAKGTFYKELEEKSYYLESGFKENLKSVSKKYAMNRVGSMMCMFFTEMPINNYDDALLCNTERYGKYFHEMLRRGIYLAPSQFEAGFLSLAHTEADIDRLLEAGREALAESVTRV